jgi:hypothetical protein
MIRGGISYFLSDLIDDSISHQEDPVAYLTEATQSLSAFQNYIANLWDNYCDNNPMPDAVRIALYQEFRNSDKMQRDLFHYAAVTCAQLAEQISADEQSQEPCNPTNSTVTTA